MDKNTLRKIKRQQRLDFPFILKEVYNKEINKKALNYLSNKNNISIFISKDEEINTKELINKLIQTKYISVPKIQGNTLIMVPINNKTQYKTNLLNIEEPVSNEQTTPNIVIVPLLAFNNKGYRIGYGKGYYDCYLKNFKGEIIGLAYSWMLEDFEADTFDIPCHKIITEKEIITFT